MSCCSSCGCSPCSCSCGCDAANEPLASTLNNFVTEFFGTVTKTCVNNAVVWTLPCDLDDGIPGFPRVDGEGLACYLIRISAAGGLSGGQEGRKAITNGLDTVSVVFPEAFDAAPSSVQVTISRPGGGDIITANVNSDSITAAGFTAELSNVVPNGNYNLEWRANA